MKKLTILIVLALSMLASPALADGPDPADAAYGDLPPCTPDVAVCPTPGTGYEPDPFPTDWSAPPDAEPVTPAYKPLGYKFAGALAVGITHLRGEPIPRVAV